MKNKYQIIADLENEVKQIESDMCWAHRGRDQEEFLKLRQKRREKIKEIAAVKD